jgi:hypothetical protein
MMKAVCSSKMFVTTYRPKTTCRHSCKELLVYVSFLPIPPNLEVTCHKKYLSLKATHCLALLLRIGEVPGSSLDPEAGYADVLSVVYFSLPRIILG